MKLDRILATTQEMGYLQRSETILLSLCRIEQHWLGK